MKKLVFVIIVLLIPICLCAQSTTIGKTKEQIRSIISSNPNFKLLPGDSCDTLSFTNVMQAIFLYKDNICYKSTSILPLRYMADVVNKMTTDSYRKIKDSIWINPEETIMVEVDTDKDKCIVVSTFYNKPK